MKHNEFCSNFVRNGGIAAAKIKSVGRREKCDYYMKRKESKKQG